MKTIEKAVFMTFSLFLIFSGDRFAAAAESEEPIARELIFKIGKVDEKVPAETVDGWVKFNPVLQSSPGYRSEIENTGYHPLFSVVCFLDQPARQDYRFRKVDRQQAALPEIFKFIEELSVKTKSDPLNGRFRMENGKVIEFSPSLPGSVLDIEFAAATIEQFVIARASGSDTPPIIELPVLALEPEIKAEEIGQLGITTLIGEGKSNFSGSPKNRIFNIRVATEKFNGILIKPGEEFSFVDTLGPVDGEHGYLPELVIKKDKTEPEFGGGICQVSTTAFRAAIYSGLRITARRNHAYPVRYYNPQGMDATVYVPKPDLRFTNNTPGHILIQTKIEGNELKFEFYGTPDGRTVEIDGPRITERRPDGGMKAVFTQLVRDQSGKPLVEETFVSNYDSPNKYPHPGQEPALTKKPDGWSDGEWKRYKKERGIS